VLSHTVKNQKIINNIVIAKIGAFHYNNFLKKMTNNKIKTEKNTSNVKKCDKQFNDYHTGILSHFDTAHLYNFINKERKEINKPSVAK